MDYLPLFPLELVAFPGESLNLHIFEPRYRELIHDCETEGLTFGIPTFLDGKIQGYGTEVRLVDVEKRYPDGKLDVRTEGIRVFQLRSFNRRAEGKQYAGGRVRYLSENNTPPDPDLAAAVAAQLGEMYRYLNIKRTAPTADTLRAYDVGHHAGLNTQQEYELLVIDNENQRLEYLHGHLVRLLPSVREIHSLRQRVQMNGHFKNILPPDF